VQESPTWPPQTLSTPVADTYGKCLRWIPSLVVDEIDLGLAAFAAALKATA